MMDLNTTVGRLMGSAGGGLDRGRGAGSSWPSPPLALHRGTSRQICGVFPWLVGGSAPMVGVPLGRVIGATGMLCADHISWFRRGLIPAPSALVLALNGLGKSTLVRRMILGLAYMGVHSMVLGDIKPDYADLVRVMGGQVITIGHGKAGLNPLDAGNVDEAVGLLANHPQERAALLASAHERKKNMVLSLIHLIRRQAPSSREEIIVDEAIRILESHHETPVLGDLLKVVHDGPQELRTAALDRGDFSRYQALTEELEVALTALMRGRLGKIFSARTTTPMMMDRSVVFDMSSLREEHSDIRAAILLACWSYGFATVEIAQLLADASVTPRRHYNLVTDEVWLILNASSGMVERIDSLTRLNRTYGVGQTMITHSMADFTALKAEEDRIRARGFVERSKMLWSPTQDLKSQP